MTQPPFWQRLKKARMAQVLVVYLGASWLVLQIADTLVDSLALPHWIMPAAIILLLVGLVVVMSTAWVQSLPATTARERAGEVPGDWAVAPRDALAALRRGRLPHLTWGRAIVGGLVALSLLFGGTGLYVGYLSPSPDRGASEVAEGIAVVPFDARGADLEMWREGMMDLLSTGLDGVGGFRSIDSRTVMARWREHVGHSATPDLAATLRAASATGAR